MWGTKKSFIVYAVAAVFLIFTAVHAQAATYYVDNQAVNASDDNSGTVAEPWFTIQHSADMAQAGDVVIVKPGVYYEAVELTQTGAAGSPLTFKGEPGAVLDGSNCWYCNGFVNWGFNPELGYDWYTFVDFITIEGFEIRNYANGIGAWPGVMDCPDWRNCQSRGGSGWVIKNNIIHDTTNGVSIWSSNSPEDAYLISNNYLYNNSWTDIHTHRYSTVDRNVALSHTEEENIRSCTAYYLDGATHQVTNNTLMNGAHGIQISYPGSTYKNNIIMNIGEWVFQNQLPSYGSDVSAVTISYNNIFNVSEMMGTWEGPQEFPADTVGNISVNPLFVNYTGDQTGDYHLTEASACINAGDPADPVPAGGGARIDIGAYEYQVRDVSSLVQAKHAFYDSGMIDNKGIMVSLDAKLNAAYAALLRGQEKTARNILTAFIMEAKAQSGKHINPGAAHSLIQDAEMLLNLIDTHNRPGKKK